MIGLIKSILQNNDRRDLILKLELIEKTKIGRSFEDKWFVNLIKDA